MTNPKITAAVEKLRSAIQTKAKDGDIAGGSVAELLRGLNHIEDLVDDELAESSVQPVSRLEEVIRMARLSPDERHAVAATMRGEAIREAKATLLYYGESVSVDGKLEEVE